jgi:hypothetical protein
MDTFFAIDVFIYISYEPSSKHLNHAETERQDHQKDIQPWTLGREAEKKKPLYFMINLKGGTYAKHI